MEDGGRRCGFPGWLGDYKKSFFRGVKRVGFVRRQGDRINIGWNGGFFTKIHQSKKSCQIYRRLQI